MTKIWIQEKPRLTINWQRIRSKILHIDDLTSQFSIKFHSFHNPRNHSSLPAAHATELGFVAGTLQLLLLLGGYQKHEGTDNNYLPINPAGLRVHNRGSQ
jgi:hypothetical protein